MTCDGSIFLRFGVGRLSASPGQDIESSFNKEKLVAIFCRDGLTAYGVADGDAQERFGELLGAWLGQGF